MVRRRSTVRFRKGAPALWLGHEQITTTQIYLHADMSHKQQAIEHRPVRAEALVGPDQQALAIAKAIRSPEEQARALEGIGNNNVLCGKIQPALAMLTKAHDLYRRIDSPRAAKVASVLLDLTRGIDPADHAPTTDIG
jgi:hypothetical protein